MCKIGKGRPSESSSLRPVTTGQRIFPVGGREYQEYSVASLNIKNLMSPTPRNCVLNALILALKDSAEAFVSRRSK